MPEVDPPGVPPPPPPPPPQGIAETVSYPVKYIKYARKLLKWNKKRNG